MSRSGCETRHASFKVAAVPTPFDIVVLAFPKSKWQDRDASKSRGARVSSWASQILTIKPEQAVQKGSARAKAAAALKASKKKAANAAEAVKAGRKAKRAEKAKQAKKAKDGPAAEAQPQQEQVQ